MLALRADGLCVADTNLFPDEAGFTPRPAWQVIEAARRQHLTGELTLPTKPATRVFMRDGLVYFAERSSDGSLPIRLMMEGVITREQMQRGTVIVNGIEHVGRMFDADPTIDRTSVELCVELFTDDLMVEVANSVVDGYELVLYRRHSSGLDRWYQHHLPLTARHGHSSGVGPVTTHEPEAAPVAKEPVKPKPKPEAPSQPKNTLNAPPITQAVPVTLPVAVTVPPPPPITQAVPVTAAPVAKTMPAPTAQIPVTPPAASADVDATAIADEVAEAIKRAFAGMGAGF